MPPRPASRKCKQPANDQAPSAQPVGHTAISNECISMPPRLASCKRKQTANVGKKEQESDEGNETFGQKDFASGKNLPPLSILFCTELAGEIYPVMPHCLATTNHHYPPPKTTVTCRSFSDSTPSLPTSIGFAAAKFGHTSMHSFHSHRRTNPRNRAVICMANERRVKMVAKQIQRELSDMLLTDQVLQYAILPEAALGADRYLSSLTTISDVEVSSDLQVVKVYVSVFGDERGKEVALSGLKSKARYVRGQLGKRMKLRLTPEIRFIEDESLERGSRVIAILDKIKSENKTVENPLVESSDSTEDWDDEEDDDIIYVK
ncbi:hypothetical protein SSX86_002825 [Deinandra increscens subsp. villosa]|uniref:Ribosome-binding factor A n=1 Tax=Deinandra increscens subsp. villosa TaxID=3103831 RepID=A0AAP0DU86_9ASTR